MCPICRCTVGEPEKEGGGPTDVVFLPRCGHRYCAPCITKWIAADRRPNHARSCPQCNTFIGKRRHLRKDELIINLSSVLRPHLEAPLLQLGDDEVQHMRDEVKRVLEVGCDKSSPSCTGFWGSDPTCTLYTECGHRACDHCCSSTPKCPVTSCTATSSRDFPALRDALVIDVARAAHRGRPNAPVQVGAGAPHTSPAVTTSAKGPAATLPTTAHPAAAGSSGVSSPMPPPTTTGNQLKPKLKPKLKVGARVSGALAPLLETETIVTSPPPKTGKEMAKCLTSQPLVSSTPPSPLAVGTSIAVLRVGQESIRIVVKAAPPPNPVAATAPQTAPATVAAAASVATEWLPPGSGHSSYVDPSIASGDGGASIWSNNTQISTVAATAASGSPVVSAVGAEAKEETRGNLRDSMQVNEATSTPALTLSPSWLEPTPSATKSKPELPVPKPESKPKSKSSASQPPSKHLGDSIIQRAQEILRRSRLRRAVKKKREQKERSPGPELVQSREVVDLVSDDDEAPSGAGTVPLPLVCARFIRIKAGRTLFPCRRPPPDQLVTLAETAVTRVLDNGCAVTSASGWCDPDASPIVFVVNRTTPPQPVPHLAGSERPLFLVGVNVCEAGGDHTWWRHSIGSGDLGGHVTWFEHLRVYRWEGDDHTVVSVYPPTALRHSRRRYTFSLYSTEVPQSMGLRMSHPDRHVFAPGDAWPTLLQLHAHSPELRFSTGIANAGSQIRFQQHAQPAGAGVGVGASVGDCEIVPVSSLPSRKRPRTDTNNK